MKATFSNEVIHAQETGWQFGVRSCIMPGLPENFMQLLNVHRTQSTVDLHPVNLD